MKEISPSFCTHKILMEDEIKQKEQPQRRLNPNMMEVVKTEVEKVMDVRIDSNKDSYKMASLDRSQEVT